MPQEWAEMSHHRWLGKLSGLQREDGIYADHGRNLSSGDITIKIKLYHYFLTDILYPGWGKEDVLFKVSFPLITSFTVEMW